MIVAPKSRWFTRWFAAHARARLERTFGRVFVAGLDDAKLALGVADRAIAARDPSGFTAMIARRDSAIGRFAERMLAALLPLPR